MSSVTGEKLSNGSFNIILNSSSEKAEVPLIFMKKSDESLFDEIVQSTRFASWATSYLPRTQQRLKLQKITVESVVVEADNEIGPIDLCVDVIRAPEQSQVGGRISLHGPSVSILIIFRVNPAGVQIDRNQDFQNDESQPSGPRPREYVLFVKQARPAVGAPEHREIPNGHIGANGVFTGPAAKAISDACNLMFYEEQLEDMTSIALSAKRAPSRSLGVALAPEYHDERVRLYLYRETVSTEFIEKLQKGRENNTHNNNSFSIDLWALNDAWRMSSDAKTLSALFLFHELKYHQLMPRYRAPREAKRSPSYTDISELNPNFYGRNLRVKVVVPVKTVTRPDRPGMTRNVVVVGDSTGIITLSLDNLQKEKNPGFGILGTPFILRNIQFDMSDRHMYIILSTFSKLGIPTKEEESNLFSFEVNTTNDLSAIEYEKINPEETNNNEFNPTTSGGYRNRNSTINNNRGGLRFNTKSRNGIQRRF